MESDGGGDESRMAAMHQVVQQRQQLAERARLPWWFWVLFGLATVGLVGSPVAGRVISSEISTWAVLVPSLAVYLLAERLVRRHRGVRLSTRVLRDYPSGRIAGLVFLAVAVAGMVVSGLLAQRGSLVVAGVVVLVTAAGMIAAMVWMQRWMRADIAAGRVG